VDGNDTAARIGTAVAAERPVAPAQPSGREALQQDSPAQVTLAVVLAGGLARRMGGGDKTLRLLGGRPLLDHVLARLQPQVPEVILNANGDPSRFTAHGLTVVQDSVPDHPGPLAGILAALDHAATRPGMQWVVSVTGDAPFIPGNLVTRLHMARAAAGLPLACARSAGQAYPPIGLWPIALRGALRAALRQGERTVGRWTARYGCAHADWPAEPFDPFFNANAPEDLEEAEGILRRIEARGASSA
jgi:molybdopterin-guanine dinucleotide biosynthesis protein A